jgi:outer membrane protein TolC
MRLGRWVVLAAAALGGCTVGPNFVAPKPSAQLGFWPAPKPVGAEGGTAVSVTVPDPIDPHWWTLFNDPEMTALEGRLATGNLDIAVYVQRLSQSRAQLGVARADEMPTLEADGS